MPQLTLAHSADADDVFMWWPITGMIDPADPARLLSPPALDTGGLTFRAVPEDIQVLNRRAIEQGDLDITAISFGTLALVAERYAPTVCGSSMGRGWGPKLVARAGEGWTLANASERACTIAIPGLNTSAFLVLSMLLEPSSRTVRRWKTVVKPFHEIVSTVARGGRGEADLGLLIHESQLTFQNEGLVLVADLGVWFNTSMKLPMPLGANVVRRDLDARFGAGTTRRVVNLLDASIRYALAHRAESLDYARRWSPLKDDASLNRYIDYYVNDLTLDCRPDGARAVELLLARGAELGVLPRMGKVGWLAADAG